MNRTFTTREKILLVVLAVLLIGCFYYLVVLQPSLSAISSSDSQIAAIQDEMLVQQAVATRKAELVEKIREAEASGVDQKTLPPYDNTKNELAELDAILAAASSYNIDFSNAETAGTLVRRNVSISFTADSYAAAEDVLQKLIDCKYSCLVTDITVSGTGLGQANAEGKVTGSASVTFFESLAQGAQEQGAQDAGGAAASS
ncbi:type II secretion system protein GspM [Arabiibacter massiliensis]|uniref:type II secretion system protein GspM n=1 Tax=Arabiibacter massiliensis TaxID=1870985 RepID=UPI00155A899D|nr:type II secretion system protein GspM [Arabiibacter massiliensis]